jgi:DNA segregation ATPase FtsK/SpoIIIE-like protein
METIIFLAAILSAITSAVTLYKVTKLERSLVSQKDAPVIMTEDELYQQAKLIAIQAGKISASFLQRRLKIGYARAAYLIDLLEDRGVIGAANGVEPRKVIVDTQGEQ